MNQKKHRKFWSLLLVLSMIFTVLPTNLVMAATTPNPEKVTELVKTTATTLSFTAATESVTSRQALQVIASTTASALEITTTYTLEGPNKDFLVLFDADENETTSGDSIDVTESISDFEDDSINETSTAALKVVYVAVKDGNTLADLTTSSTDFVVVTLQNGIIGEYKIPIEIVYTPGSAPTIVSAAVTDEATAKEITVTFSKAMAAEATPTGFTVEGTTHGGISVGAIAAGGTTMVITLTNAIQANEIVKVAYTATDETIVAADGGVLATNATGVTVTGTPTSTTGAAPTIVSAAVTDEATAKEITVTFNKPMAEEPTPAGFTVTGTTHGGISVGAIAAGGTTMVITLTNAIQANEIVKVAYTAGTIKAADGGVLATNTTGVTVTGTPIVDPVDPAITSISSSSKPVFLTGDKHSSGKQSVQVTAHTASTFPEVVTTYTLEGPNAAKFALYTSKDATDAMTSLEVDDFGLHAISTSNAELTPIYIGVRDSETLTTVTNADDIDYISVSILGNESVNTIIPITINKKPTVTPKPDKDDDDDDKTTKPSTSSNSTSTPTSTPKPTAADVAVTKPTEAQKVTVNAAVVKAKVTVASEPVIVKFPKGLEGTFTPITVTLANITNITESTILVRINADGTMTPILANLTKDANGVVHANLLVNDGGTIVAINSTPQKFNDVKSGDWYSKYVDSVATKLYMTGMGMDSNGSNYFDPTATLTASQTSSIMLRILGIAPAPAKAGDNWDTGVIAKAKELGINNTANSNAPMSRKDTANAIINALKVAGVAKDLSVTEANSLVGGFKDLSRLSGAEKQTMAACIKYNIFVGNGDGTMSPDANLTRAQMATLIDKVLKKAKGSF